MRKRKSNYRKASKKTRRMIRWSVVGVVVLALLLFWGLFYITEVEVVGNTRYTEKEVENMAMEGFFARLKNADNGNRVLPPSRLVRRDDSRLLPHSQRLPQVLQ